VCREKKEQEKREVGQWSEGRKEMAFSERKQEGERKRDKEMEKERRRGLLYKDASEYKTGAESVAEDSGGLLLSGSQTHGTWGHG